MAGLSLQSLKAQITDGDGNTYTSVNIGSQTWLGENLKTTTYNDGSAITNITDSAVWASQTSPAYCWYNNSISNKATYGALYNWFVVNSTSNGNKNVCPVGWHVPAISEWSTLVSDLGSLAGGMLKETGTTDWYSPNTGATNSTGFDAVGAGYRSSTANFLYFVAIWGYCGFWSTSAAVGETGYAQNAYLLNTDATCHLDSHYQQYGFSIRCVKNVASELPDANTPNNMSIYPNPNDGQFTILFPNQGNNLIDINISDISGKTVFETKSTQDKYYYNGNPLKSGIYIITIKGENLFKVSKMVVNK
jgi:uncharacterized protein (TIGR02145 family)